MRHIGLHPSKKYTAIALAAIAACAAACTDASVSGPTEPSAVAAISSPARGSSALAELTLRPGSIDSQGKPEGTVTLSAPAPSGGAVLSLASTNPDIAKVPPTLMVAAGMRSARFLVDTATIPEPAPVTITVAYSGSSLQATMTVRSLELLATFEVRGPSKGPGGCRLGPDTGEADCVLDARGSRGFVASYVWTLTLANNRVVHTTTDADWGMRIPMRCAFFEGGRGGDDAGGHYVHMEIELQVHDRGGRRSGAVRQSARLYPNRLCGFSS